MQLNIGYASHKGNVKKRQEDSILVDHQIMQENQLGPFECILDSSENIFLAVADGIGGYPGGDVASRILLNELDNETKKKSSFNDGWMTEDSLHLIKTNFIKKLINKADTSGAGTTLVVAQIRSNHVRVLNVGDSPAYLINQGGLSELSTEHAVDHGLLSQYLDPDDDDVFIEKKLDSAFIVQQETFDFKIAMDTTKLTDNSGLLLCSDGLISNAIREKGLLSSLDWSLSPMQQVAKWQDAVLAIGARDNVSIIWVRFK